MPPPAPHRLLNRGAPQTGVWPPAGSALRGTTLGLHLASGPDVFLREYALPAHILRTFRRLPSKNESRTLSKLELTESERLHVARGGYLWYNLKCGSIQACVTGRYDEEIRAAAAAVRGAAPARIMVCVQHEWDHRLNAAPPDAQGRCPSPGKDECSSGANMRRLFGHIQKSFDEAGASNAVGGRLVEPTSSSRHAVGGAPALCLPRVRR